MKRILIVILTCLMASSFATAQKATDASVEGARAALIQFIELSNRQALRSEQARKLLVAEAASWDVSSFGKLADAPDKVILLDKNLAVGRVQWFGENNYVADMYFYLRFDSGWKIGAMRRLALTGIVEDLYLALKAKKNLTQEEKDTLANVELVLASDKVLKEWFLQNHEALNNLYSLARPKVVSESLYINDSDKHFPEIAQSLKRLHLNGINMQANGNVEIVIGGRLDNTVGFIYSPSKNPPSISASSYIWVEEIADKWYLFRTT
jgi:hypothetical protein